MAGISKDGFMYLLGLGGVSPMTIQFQISHAGRQSWTPPWQGRRDGFENVRDQKDRSGMKVVTLGMNMEK